TSLAPQQSSAGAVVTAQVNLPPPSTLATPLPRPETSTGIVLFSVVPSPSSPWLFKPQHFRPLFCMSAHVWYSPAESSATPVVKPWTGTGVQRSIVDPSPIWPAKFAPQHFAPPSCRSAQLWRAPTEIAPTPLERPVTSTGV